jgi:Holliday junction resolvase YEN1
MEVLSLYLHPMVHEYDFAARSPLNFTSGNLHPVDLARFATTTFQWGRTAQCIFNRYRDLIFPAMAIRQLIQAAVDIDEGRSVPGSCCPLVGNIISERNISRTCFLREVRVLLIIPAILIRQICTIFVRPALDQTALARIDNECKKYRAWVPRAMVETVLPDRVAAYEAAKKKTS